MSESTVIWSPGAEAALRKLDGTLQKRILEKAGELGHDPLRQVTRLVKSTDYRLRVGDWRAIVETDRAAARVTILDVGHRRSIYR